MTGGGGLTAGRLLSCSFFLSLCGFSSGTLASTHTSESGSVNYGFLTGCGDDWLSVCPLCD